MKSSLGLLAMLLCACSAPAAPVGLVDTVPGSSEGVVRASTLADQCPKGDYSLEDRDAAACYYYLTAFVDLVANRSVVGVPESCRRVVRLSPLTTTNTLRESLVKYTGLEPAA